MMKDNFKILYDKEADVLYVSLGHPKFTDYVELDDDFILRLDPETKEVVGFTIVDFATHFAKQKPSMTIPLMATFERATQSPRAKVVAEKKATYRVKRNGNDRVKNKTKVAAP